MDVREKLVELIGEIASKTDDERCRKCVGQDCVRCTYENVAEHLLANKVTIIDWISVNDKLPPYNRDVLVYRPNMAMKILVDSYDGYYGDDDEEWYEGWALYGKDIHGKPIITHWAYLPQPPKGE